MSVQTERRCEHLACVCDVGGADTACSDYCGSEEARDPHDVICRCGHEPCATAQEAQLEGGTGKESP